MSNTEQMRKLINLYEDISNSPKNVKTRIYEVMKKLRIEYSRKPNTLGDVLVGPTYETFMNELGEITTDMGELPTLTDVDIYGHEITDKTRIMSLNFQIPVPNIFILNTTGYGRYLVNTENYSYMRYIFKFAD